MCRSNPTRRCAAHTGVYCEKSRQEYRQAFPSGPDITPLVQPQQSTATRLDPAEIDLLTHAGAATLEAYEQLADATTARDRILAAQQAERAADLDPRMQAVTDRFHTTEHAASTTRAAARAAETALLNRTLELYQQAGLSPEDTSYATRELEDLTGRTYDPAGLVPMEPLPDPSLLSDHIALGDVAARASAAAGNDPAYAALYEQAVAAQDAEKTAAVENRDAARALSDVHQERFRLVQSQAGELAPYTAAVERAEAALATAQDNARYAGAQVASGVGAHGTRTALSRVGASDIVVNPDGTTNAWVYQAPAADDAHGYGRYVPVAKVTTRPDQSGAYQVELADGTVLAPRTTEASTRTGRLEQHDFDQAVVHLTAPKTGARPAIDATDRLQPFYLLTSR